MVKVDADPNARVKRIKNDNKWTSITKESARESESNNTDTGLTKNKKTVTFEEK